MRVTKKLNVPAAYVYHRILESVLYDISEHTGESLSPSQLAGFQYEKKIGENSHVSIEILALEPEKKYQFSTKTEKNTFDTLYEIETLTDESCQVHYVETVTSYGTVQSLNDRIVGIIFGTLRKKRIQQLLHEIESSRLSAVEN